MGYGKKSISFTLRGRDYTLSVGDVIASMKGVQPENIVKYYMEIGGEDYPPKQVLSKALGVPKISFTTKDAYDILTRLGFSVKKYESSGDKTG